MIELASGDILKSPAEALVNTVNCVGVMGRGIALQFKHAFPENFSFYARACDRGTLQPGMMLVFEVHEIQGLRYIINFPTKKHWKGASRMEDIESGLRSLVAEVRERKIQSIAVPPLGCGLGGLKWEHVRPRIEAAFAELPDVRVLLYEPAGAPAAASMVKSKQVPKLTPGRVALLGLVRRYLAALMDPWVTLLEIHKLMYFLQEAGEPLKLNYQKAHYGPYAKNLRQVLIRIEGHYLIGYGDGEDDPTHEIELLPAAIKPTNQLLSESGPLQERFQRVGQLIEGFETPYGMELLATVHWVATREGASTPIEATDRIHAWNDRKKRFTLEQIRCAWDVLLGGGWFRKSISCSASPQQ